MKNGDSKQYFNQDINDRIRDMTEKEMRSALLELEGTHMWIAILRYLQERMVFAQSGLMSIDPISETTKLCRVQGILTGLSDLQNAVIMIKQGVDTETEKGVDA